MILKTSTLSWVQTSLRDGEFQLLANNGPVAMLRWESWGRTGVLGSAQAGWKDEKWRFEAGMKNILGGYVSTATSLGKVTIRRIGSETEIATLNVTGTGVGFVEFSDGRILHWKTTSGYWHPFRDLHWTFLNIDGDPLVRVSRDLSLNPIRRPSGTVEVESEAEQIPEIHMLVLLGLFLIIRWMRK